MERCDQCHEEVDHEDINIIEYEGRTSKGKEKRWLGLCDYCMDELGYQNEEVPDA